LAEVRAACLRLSDVANEVELVTVHAAKGREWSRVIIFGVDEGQMPHAQALKNGDLEDERRLFYVAMTRAKDRLEIICTSGSESRFLQEAHVR
jgi:DNA helicase-2/ATP-dependent DNA helicase PcrA